MSLTWSNAFPGISAVIVGLRGYEIVNADQYLNFGIVQRNFTETGISYRILPTLSNIINTYQFVILATCYQCIHKYEMRSNSNCFMI